MYSVHFIQEVWIVLCLLSWKIESTSRVQILNKAVFHLYFSFCIIVVGWFYGMIPIVYLFYAIYQLCSYAF